MCDLRNVLQTRYHEFLPGYKNLDWFVDEVKEIKTKKSFENIKKDILMAGRDEKYYRDNNISRLCDKKIVADKVRDHC